MLFDLEIQPDLIDIVYIKSGGDIDSSLVPIAYCNISERNITPADLIDIEENIKFDTFASSEIITMDSDVREMQLLSDKFLVTHIKKYSNTTGTEVPLFYKHTVKVADMTELNEESFRITTLSGNMLDQDSYAVEYLDDSFCVYINPIQDDILTFEYSLKSGVTSELMKLQKVFAQTEFDWIIQGEDLSKFEYLFFGNKLITGYLGTRYIIYQRNISMIKKPIAAINDPWYLRIENINFTETIGNNDINFFMPEFNIQLLTPGLQNKSYREIPAKIINKKYIKLQESVAYENIPSVNIYIKNIRLNNAIEYIFTMSEEKINTIDLDNNVGIGSGLRWIAMDDWNSEGIFELPVELTADHIATSDFKVNNEYYEFSSLNLNSSDINSNKLVGIFMRPVIPGDSTTTSVFFCYIGIEDSSQDDYKLSMNGSGFKDKDNYRTALISKNCVHLAYISLSSVKISNMYEFFDVRNLKQEIIDKDISSLINYDIFINDLMNGEITISTGDTLLASISEDILAKKEDTFSDKEKYLIDEKNSIYINFVKDTLMKSLDISTDIIIKNNF